MKILITTHHLDSFSGSELFTRDLAIELNKRGHKVFIYAPILGEVSNDLKKKNKEIIITTDLRSLRKYNFDIIHAQHNTTAILARSVFPKVPMVFIVHGILPELEQPPSINVGISKFMVVSEEARDHLIKRHEIKRKDIIIIRNFIDIEKFKSTNSLNAIPKRLLVMSNHYTDEIRKNIEQVCNDLRIKIDHIGAPENIVRNVKKYINQADIVVTLGRGALEAMACERNVIVYNIHGGDGFIDENNFLEIRKNNFSGRRYKKQYSVDEFKEEVLKYNLNTGKKLRKIIIEENNTEKTISKMEEIYEETIKKGVAPSILKENVLFNELNFLEAMYYFLHIEGKESINFIDQFKEKIKRFNKQIQQGDEQIQQQHKLIQQKEQKIKEQNTLIQQKTKQQAQQIQRIRKLKNSKSFKLGNLLFRSVKKPYKLITFPYNFIKIVLS